MRKVHQIATFINIDELNRFLYDNDYKVVSISESVLHDYYAGTSTVCNYWYEFILAYEMKIDD